MDCSCMPLEKERSEMTLSAERNYSKESYGDRVSRGSRADQRDTGFWGNLSFGLQKKDVLWCHQDPGILPS